MSLISFTARRTGRRALAAALALGLCTANSAAELVVRVGGLAPPLGQAGCSLFASASGFPMDSSAARTLWSGLRAPRFDEAVFQVGADGKDVVIDIKVAK